MCARDKGRLFARALFENKRAQRQFSKRQLTISKIDAGTQRKLFTSIRKNMWLEWTEGKQLQSDDAKTQIQKQHRTRQAHICRSAKNHGIARVVQCETHRLGPRQQRWRSRGCYTRASFLPVLQHLQKARRQNAFRKDSKNNRAR